MFLVRTIRTVRVYDPLPEAARAFATEMSAYLGTNIEVTANARGAVEGADVICAATVSSTPVFADADIAPGTHINAIGSYKPNAQEIPAETVSRALTVVDHRESALAEAGDLMIPLQQGLITEADIHAELGEVLNGKTVGRTSDDAVTLFKSVGVAVQDLAAASRALARAEAERLGAVVPL